jgi:hypothetical protein
VDVGSSGFLSDLCLVVASYNDMFINRPHLHDVQQWYEYSAVKRSGVHDESILRKFLLLFSSEQLNSIKQSFYVVLELDPLQWMQNNCELQLHH